MTDRPILFSGPMVRALIEGRKTQTRRVLKPQPVSCLSWGDPPAGSYPSKNGWSRLRYAVGDRLWVREAWRLPDCYDDHTPSGFVAQLVEGGMPGPNGLVRFEADGRDAWCDAYPDLPLGRLRPGMHLPRMLTRLTLTVTEVRMQRLQGISSADAIADGFPPHGNSLTIDCDTPDPRNDFRRVWDSVNGPGAWDLNPWVAAYTFTVEPRNIDAMTAEAARCAS